LEVSRNQRTRIVLAAVACISMGQVGLLGGCGGTDSSSAVTVASAKDYADGARKIEENNRKHIKEALAARKASRAR
jgi:hypothetical protein